MPTRNKNKPQKISMRVTTTQYEIQVAKNHICSVKAFFLQSIIYPPEKTFIGTGSILARGKSRVLPTDPLFALGETGYSCGLPATSAFDITHILADILRCPYNVVKISQR